MDGFKEIKELIVELGQWALSKQHSVKRNIKKDGSVITEVDLAINEKVTHALTRLYPGCQIVTEEADALAGDGEYVFVLDPIDGTDSFSMGMSGWCVALGILDAELNPIGGIVSAPALFQSPSVYSLEPGGVLMLNDEPFVRENLVDDTPFPEEAQVLATSRCHRYFDCSAYDGKIRNLGSSILHVMGPLLHPDFGGSIVTHCFAWDIAAGHAIIKSQGLDLYAAKNGKLFAYDQDMLQGKQRIDKAYYGGSPEFANKLNRILTCKI